MQADTDDWNGRYRHLDDVTPKAPDPLDRRPDLASRLARSGQAIDIACGAGAQTLWLATRGLDVIALDVSDVAIDALVKQSTTVGLAERIDARVVDLDDGLPADLPPADVLVCQRFRDPALYPRFAELLAPGGTGIVTVLSVVGAAARGRFHAPAGELASAFERPALEVLHHEERHGEATIVVHRLR